MQLGAVFDRFLYLTGKGSNLLLVLKGEQRYAQLPEYVCCSCSGKLRAKRFLYEIFGIIILLFMNRIISVFGIE